MSITIFLRVCLCFLVRLTKISQSGFWRSLNATARWWFSSTDSSLYLPSRSQSLYYHNDIGSAKPYMMASSELLLIRNWLVRPGWSTSWMAAAKMADITSSGVNTHWATENIFLELIKYFSSALTSSAGELRRTWVDWVTSAPCTLLWYGTSDNVGIYLDIYRLDYI